MRRAVIGLSRVDRQTAGYLQSVCSKIEFLFFKRTSEEQIDRALFIRCATRANGMTRAVQYQQFKFPEYYPVPRPAGRYALQACQRTKKATSLARRVSGTSSTPRRPSATASRARLRPRVVSLLQAQVLFTGSDRMKS
jgi:hypothetical protein